MASIKVMWLPLKLNGFSPVKSLNLMEGSSDMPETCATFQHQDNITDIQIFKIQTRNHTYML